MHIAWFSKSFDLVETWFGDKHNKTIDTGCAWNGGPWVNNQGAFFCYAMIEFH